MTTYHSRTSLLAALQQDKSAIQIPLEYTDFAEVLPPDFAIELPKNPGINEHAIELIEGKQSVYGPIYIPGFVELETLKTYIKTFLKPGLFGL